MNGIKKERRNRCLEKGEKKQESKEVVWPNVNPEVTAISYLSVLLNRSRRQVQKEPKKIE